MLPGVFKALEETLTGTTPTSLGLVIFLESMAASAASMPWGLAADMYCKLTLLRDATLMTGALALGTACVHSLPGLALVRTLAGACGAALGPISQAIVGIVCRPTERGRGFALLVAAGEAGELLGVILATSLSHVEAGASHTGRGWRVAFGCFAVFTVAVAGGLTVLHRHAMDGTVRRSRVWGQLLRRGLLADGGSAHAVGAAPLAGARVGAHMGDFLQGISGNWSFLILIVVGAFTTCISRATEYRVMWCQYLGFSDREASLIACLVTIGCMVGALGGGILSDRLHQAYPVHGRLFLGQFAELARSLLIVVIMHLGWLGHGEPSLQAREVFYPMAVVAFTYGLFALITYSCVVKPLFVEIVPSRHVAQAYALAFTFDGAFAALIGGPMVGMITDRVYHYRETELSVDQMSPATQRENANALGAGMNTVALASSLLTFASLSVAHFTYQADTCTTSRGVDQPSK